MGIALSGSHILTGSSGSKLGGCGNLLQTGARGSSEQWLLLVEGDFQLGNSSSMRALVRQLSRKRRRTGLASAQVLRCHMGALVDGPDSMARAWEEKFLAEFRGNGVISDSPSFLDPSVSFEVALPEVSPISRCNWARCLEASVCKVRLGSALGPDQLPGELSQIGTPDVARVLVSPCLHGGDLWSAGGVAGTYNGARPQETVGAG